MAESKNNLAVCWANMGKLVDAKHLLQRVVEKQEKKFGCNHPHTLMSKHRLAVVLEMARRSRAT